MRLSFRLRMGREMSADLNYYKRRLEAERGLVSKAASEEIAALHKQLAELYEKMINALEAPPEAA